MADIIFKTKDGSLIMNRQIDGFTWGTEFIPRWITISSKYNTDNYPDWKPTEQQLRFLNYDAREKGVKILSVKIKDDTIYCVVDYL